MKDLQMKDLLSILVIAMITYLVFAIISKDAQINIIQQHFAAVVNWLNYAVDRPFFEAVYAR